MPSIRKAVLLLTLTLPITGCALDLNKLAADIRRPKVVFTEAVAWRCEPRPAMIPTRDGALQSCSVCQNIAPTPQIVTINKTEHTVEPQGTVASCETSAFVNAPLPSKQPAPTAAKR